jgi:phosphoglycerate dehydrogenase-like enzyme
MAHPPGRDSEEALTVLIDTALPPEQAERIRGLAPRIVLTEKVSVESLHGAHIIYTTKAAFDPAGMPNLRWVQLDTAAVNHVMNTPIARSGIPVANVRGAYSVAVAELTIAILLALTRRLGRIHSLQLEQQWPKDFLPLQGDDNYGKTMGIVGYGSIGRHVARIAKAMGMTVLAWKRRPEVKHDSGFQLPNTGDPEGVIPQRWFGVHQLEEMLRLTDVAVVTLPITPETRGLIGRRQLEVLPPHAYLINVGRGGTIDEEALIECLRTDRLAGLGLDVFSCEPLEAESPLWKLPNVLITPHVGSYSRRQKSLAAEVLIENLSRHLTDQPLINLVDFEAGY